MRHEAARQCHNGYFHWTARWDERTICYPPCTVECKHITKEDAERHHYEYGISKLATRTTEAWYRCEAYGCAHLTNMMLGPPFRWGQGNYLCPEHHNISAYRALNPFVPGYEFWGS